MRSKMGNWKYNIYKNNNKCYDSGSYSYIEVTTYGVANILTIILLIIIPTKTTHIYVWIIYIE